MTQRLDQMTSSLSTTTTINLEKQLDHAYPSALDRTEIQNTLNLTTLKPEQLTHIPDLENAAQIGQYIVDQIREQLKEYQVKVRGFGMMIGIELPKDCGELVNIARDEYKLIINVTAGSVVRLLPPLNMTQEQADDLIQRLIPAIKNFLEA